MKNISEDVYAALRAIPEGKVTTYGDLAAHLGDRRMARAVGNILHANPDPDRTPCFRVVNRDGRLAAHFGDGGAEGQRRRLERDGIEVRDGRVDLKKYLYTFENKRKP